tara:strand:- start:25 stop:201 length:177 start_codon:yes stop_codon:yes gene_type:complete
MVLRVGHLVSTPQPWLQMVVEEVCTSTQLVGAVRVQVVQVVLAALAMVAAMVALVELA